MEWNYEQFDSDYWIGLTIDDKLKLAKEFYPIGMVVDAYVNLGFEGNISEGVITGYEIEGDMLYCYVDKHSYWFGFIKPSIKQIRINKLKQLGIIK